MHNVRDHYESRIFKKRLEIESPKREEAVEKECRFCLFFLKFKIFYLNATVTKFSNLNPPETRDFDPNLWQRVANCDVL